MGALPFPFLLWTTLLKASFFNLKVDLRFITFNYGRTAVYRARLSRRTKSSSQGPFYPHQQRFLVSGPGALPKA